MSDCGMLLHDESDRALNQIAAQVCLFPNPRAAQVCLFLNPRASQACLFLPANVISVSPSLRQNVTTMVLSVAVCVSRRGDPTPAE